MRNTTHYVAITPDGKEHFFEIGGSARDAACDACRESGITSARRAEPTVVAITVHEIMLKGGQTIRGPKNVFNVNAPLEPMTTEDFEIEMKEALEDLPEEFASYVRNASYERGHAYGMEEVASIARDMAYELSQAFKAYTKRINAAN